MNTNKTNAIFFENMYQERLDPWQFASNNYELGRYQRIYEAIEQRPYDSIFEPGCSIGVLTAMLSHLGNEVHAIDISLTATQRAQARCSHLKNVHIQCQSLQEYSPTKKTDLIILSEIGYYFESTQWQTIITQLLCHCAHNAIILASHWLGYSDDHLISGEKVHEIIHTQKQLTLQNSQCYKDFHIERWVKTC